MKDIRLNFGENVKKLRIELGLTQGAFAEQVDLSMSFLQNIETGKRWAGPETVSALARALKVREADLFRDEPSPKTSAPEPKQLLQILCQALGIVMEEAMIKKLKVTRAHSYYAPFYQNCPDDVGALLLDLCQSEGWDWEHLRAPLLKLKKKK
jgi:transcriptional regulator with XRE-family HTH domain